MADGCSTCAGYGWVCEKDHAKPWGGVCDAPPACACPSCAGDPCPVCNTQRPPAWPPGTREIAHKDKGTIQ